MSMIGQLHHTFIEITNTKPTNGKLHNQPIKHRKIQYSSSRLPSQFYSYTLNICSCYLGSKIYFPHTKRQLSSKLKACCAVHQGIGCIQHRNVVMTKYMSDISQIERVFFFEPLSVFKQQLSILKLKRSQNNSNNENAVNGETMSHYICDFEFYKIYQRITFILCAN